MKNEDSIIAVGDKSYIKSEVIHLKSKYATKIGINPDRLSDVKWYYFDMGAIASESQHLYFLSDETTKGEEVWHYNSVFKTVSKEKSYGYKKIIATTDESIGTKMSSHTQPTFEEGDYMKAFPRPSNDFLQAYAKANGRIGEVLIEIKLNGSWIPERSSGYMGCRCEKCQTWVYDNQPLICDCGHNIVVAPDNTMTIKKTKEKKFTEQEMKSFAKQFAIDMYNEHYGRNHISFKERVDTLVDSSFDKLTNK